MVPLWKRKCQHCLWWNFSKIHHHFTRILLVSVHFVKQGECLRIQCQVILPHGGAKILQDFWSKYKVKTTKGGFLKKKKRKGSFHICQDPLYRALVVLGLGHKVQINVMSTLGVEEIKAAFLESFSSACKGQPTTGWDKWVKFCSEEEEEKIKMCLKFFCMQGPMC